MDKNMGESVSTNEGLAAKMREIRLASGMSVRALAKKSGVSMSTIANFEHGRTTPGVLNLRKIALGLGYELEIKLIADPDFGDDPVPQAIRNVIADSLRQMMADTGSNIEDIYEATNMDAETIEGVLKGVVDIDIQDAEDIADHLGYPLECLFVPYEEWDEIESYAG